MSNSHIIKEAFGKHCDLYSDVLECPRDANSAALRRAYYRSALKYHPDKVLLQQQPQHPSDSTNTKQKSNEKFHAITAAYQILCNAELRKEYDTTGVLPDTNDDDDEFNSSTSNNNGNPWKEYFDRIFGKVTSNDIDLFATKYKCSEEEQRDVLQQYVQQKGNLTKMLHHVMLSEHIDVVRWVQDYINPAIQNQTLTSQYNDTMQKTLQQVQAKIEKERNKKSKDKTKTTNSKGSNDTTNDQEDVDDDEEEDEDYDDEIDEDDNDDDETETDEEEDIPPPRVSKKKNAAQTTASTKSPLRKKAQASVKAKRAISKSSATNATATATTTTKKSKNSATDLISLIQNKHRNHASSNSAWSDFGARYGVTIPENDDNEGDDDPIPDNATFQKIQSKLKNNNRKKK